MNIKPYFNPPHSQDFMKLKDDMHHTPSYNESSPCDDIEFLENVNNEKPLEKYALNPFDGYDPILHYAKAFEKGHNWVMHPIFSSPNCWIQNLNDNCSLIKPNISTFVSKFKCKKRTTNCFKSNIKMSYTTKSKKSWQHSLTTMHNKKSKTNYKQCFWLISMPIGEHKHKKKSTSIHKSLIETIKKGNVALIKSINQIMYIETQVQT
jgi:hypothetical protein